MDTKSKIHEALSMLGAASKNTIVDGVVAEALNELATIQKEAASLREQLRLTNDKMAEQVRQARYEVADEALKKPLMQRFLEKVRDANAPKD